MIKADTILFSGINCPEDIAEAHKYIQRYNLQVKRDVIIESDLATKTELLIRAIKDIELIEKL